VSGDSEVLRDARVVRAERRRNIVERFGGFDWLASFIGFAVATFFTVVFLGIVGAIIGAAGYQLHAQVPKLGSHISGTTEQLGIGALVGSLIAVFLAYLIGGYTAGRLARYSGVRNGAGTVFWTIVVAIVLGIIGAILGSKFNVTSQLHLNVDRTTLTAGGAISLVVTLVVMLIASMLGGLLGERYHRAIDREVGVLP